VLDYSKIEAGSLDLDPHPFDVRRCVEDALDTVAPQASAKGLHIGYDVDRGVPRVVVADASRVRQVLINLLSNAVKFTVSGDVTVAVTAAGLQEEQIEIQFAVADTGIGIPRDRFDRLFKSFSQVDASTTRQYGGTGLGLAISERLTALLGGRIWVESEVGKGTRFFFTVLARPADARDMSRVDASDNTPASIAALAGRRLLIVAQHAATLQFLRNNAERWGLRVSEATSRSAALSRIRTGERFDAAIIDGTMDNSDPRTLADEMRKLLHPHTPHVILLRPLGDAGSGDGGVFAASLTKPLKTSSLYDALVVALSPAQIASTPTTAAPAERRLADRYPMRILVAEDNVVNQRVASAMLGRFGYQVDLAANGVEAVEAVRNAAYDLVLMDLQMPELDGLGAVRQILAEHPPERRPRIVALTANAFAEDRDACLAAGMDDYLSKPLRSDTLEQALLRAVASGVRPGYREADAADPTHSPQAASGETPGPHTRAGDD
jgi:CheY-like chemotaxis protein